MSEQPTRAAAPKPRLARASAPGRVNLIGEHTDYNEGFVLPMAIPQETQVLLRPHDDRSVRVVSRERPEGGSYRLGDERATGGFIDYVQGVTVALRTSGMTVGGFEAEVSSQVPMGAGLSSSAALEVALLRALREAFGLPLSDLEIARLGRSAEVDFVGVPVGIMDQMASSLGQPGRALFIDTRTLATRDVPLPEQLELVVIASGVVHAHDGGEYKVRRQQCVEAARQLGVPALRDASLAQLQASSRLEPLLRKRARHIITENERVLATIVALVSTDEAALAQLFAASHASMRDDFEITIPAIDLLVSLATAQAGVVAARMTGGGFGGSIVALAQRGRGKQAALAVAEAYRAQTGLTPTILLPLE